MSDKNTKIEKINLEDHFQDRDFLRNFWEEISLNLKKELGDAKWRAWIKPLSIQKVNKGILVLLAENDLTRDRVKAQYSDKIKIFGYNLNKNIKNVKIKTNDKKFETNANSEIFKNFKTENRFINEKKNNNYKDLKTLDGLDKRFTFENFVVGKPNELAFAAARRVAETTSACFNPLFLYGGVGLGKTHLMHAIAWEINSKQPERTVIYLSAEKFMYRFIRAIRYKDMMTFKEQFRSVDVLMIDDVQFISGKDSTQEEFFHTFNALVEDGRQVILSADKSPTDLSGMEERLRSRLGWGMVADIHPANYELRLGILQNRAEKSEVSVPDKVLDFLARKITSNVREIEGAFNRIIAHATLVGRDITIELTKDILSDLLRASNRKITVDDIQKQVAVHFNIRISDMFSARRSRQIARPRQIAMYLSKNLTSLSYPEIGRKFGNRDHTTIMHAVKKIEDVIKLDPELSDDIQILKSMLADK